MLNSTRYGVGVSRIDVGHSVKCVMFSGGNCSGRVIYTQWFSADKAIPKTENADNLL